MRRMAFAVAALVACCAPARADTLPLIEGVPATYTPGQSFTFTLRVPELVALSNYTLELTLSTEVTDPALTAFPTVASADRYVFPTSANFGYQFDAPPGTQEVRLTLSDAIDPDSVNTTSGQNDTLATVTVVPGADLTGPITLTVTRADFSYNTEAANYDPPGSVTIDQGEPTVGNPVPAPPGVVLLGIGGLVLGARARFVRRAT